MAALNSQQLQTRLKRESDFQSYHIIIFKITTFKQQQQKLQSIQRNKGVCSIHWEKNKQKGSIPEEAQTLNF